MTIATKESALLLVVAAASAGAYNQNQLGYRNQNQFTCAEARQNDEIIFDCGGEFISQVAFASYGTPTGHCDQDNGEGFIANPTCDAHTTEAIIEERCLGQTTCMFIVTDELFGGDPCPGRGQVKMLAARLACGDHVAAELAAKDAATRAISRRRLGAGWRFIASVVFLFSLYCALGIAHSVRRLNVPLGVAAIPHLDMWKDLPFLVRDGIIFSVDTLKSKARAKYDPVL